MHSQHFIFIVGSSIIQTEAVNERELYHELLLRSAQWAQHNSFIHNYKATKL